MKKYMIIALNIVMSVSLYGMEQSDAKAQNEEKQKEEIASAKVRFVEPEKEKKKRDKCYDSKLCGGLACIFCGPCMYGL